MIYGIPYTDSLEYDIEINREFDDIASMIEEYASKKMLVIIDDKWFTWLKDIKFNYRDKECYLPYYSFDTYKTNKKYKFRKDYQIINEDGFITLRYNFVLHKLVIDDGVKELVMLDTESKTKIRVSWKTWFKDQTFDINKLYNLYLDSCFNDKFGATLDYDGGYHYIDREVKGFKNKERELRAEYGLSNYGKEHIWIKDYRDVREYTYSEVIKKAGIRLSDELYKIRRLRFESYLYCLMRADAVPNENILGWSELGDKNEYIKYGTGIKLIIKAYWKNGENVGKRKTWSRVGW